MSDFQKTSFSALKVFFFQLAFAAGQSIKLDNRVAALLLFRSAPLEIIDLELYPALYQLNHFDKVCPTLISLQLCCGWL